MLRPNQRGVLLAAQWLAHILSSQQYGLSIGLTLRTLNTRSTDSPNSTTTYRSVRHISLVSLVKCGYPEVGFTHEMAQAFPNVSYIRSDDRPTAGLETSLANLRYLQISSDFPPAHIFLSSPFLSALALMKSIGSDCLCTWSSPQLKALRVEHDLDMDASTTVALIGELFPELRSLDVCVAVQRPTELQQVFKSHNPCQRSTQGIRSTLPKLKSLTLRWKTSARSDAQIIDLDAVQQFATSHLELVNYNAAVGIQMTRFWNYMAWRAGNVRSSLVPSLAGILPSWYQDEAFA
ncbi:hypothetical protein BKA62DRAFT_731459 [Auriculariales sp. MPI-PUGE-AT-0066]|nr:hypothetical protein BKA62DRAFT_731459 [Auriculariales sp. MPI-PUGE-AT-0066]